MSRLINNILFVICLFLIVVFSDLESVNASVLARVERVVDGDSLVVEFNNHTIEVRLWGVDAPEWKQSFGRKSKQFLDNKIRHRLVSIEPKHWDEYGRLIGVVSLGVDNINALMVKSGYAWVYNYYCKEEVCIEWGRYQSAARLNKLGLWSGKKPIPPWRWRFRRK